MNDALDKMPDAELSEVFAVEVAGWKNVRYEGQGINRFMVGKGPLSHYEHSPGWEPVPPFATSADAVLPYLGKCVNFEVSGYSYSKGITVRIRDCGPRLRWFTVSKAKAPTFARAACIALIRAKRAEKGTG